MFGFVNFHFLTKLFKTTATKSEKLPYLCTTVTLSNLQTIKLYKHEQSYGIGFSSSALDHLLGSAFNSTGDVFFYQLVVSGVERRISKKPGGAFQMGAGGPEQALATSALVATCRARWSLQQQRSFSASALQLASYQRALQLKSKVLQLVPTLDRQPPSKKPPRAFQKISAQRLEQLTNKNKKPVELNALPSK